MKFGRVGSPAAVPAAYATKLAGVATSAGLTAMRPARPVVCDPVAEITPVIGLPPSVNSGTCALPLANVLAVAVADSALTVVAPTLSACKVPPALENCSDEPNAALSCDTTALRPPEKSMPMVWLFGLACEFCSGSEPPGPSDTIVMVCAVLPASV